MVSASAVMLPEPAAVQNARPLPPINVFVNSLLRRMTLEEKPGRLTQWQATSIRPGRA
ncbi:MAG: hypothetical protein ACT4O1_11465 [Gemmatimonadota bacterium]